MSKVFVVVLNWERANDTIDCINSLLKSKNNSFELKIVVVDNGSKDNSESILKQTFKDKIVLIENASNIGFAQGNNIGIKYSLGNNADYVMILNNDTLVSPDLIAVLHAAFLKDESVGLASPKIYFAPGFEFHKRSLLVPSKARYRKEDLGRVIWYAGGTLDWDNIYGSTRGVDEVDEGQYDSMQETDFATGTCLFLSRKVLEEVGMFDEKYYLYYEDTDFSIRAKKARFKVLYIPNAVVWHKVAQSSGIGSDLNDYYKK